MNMIKHLIITALLFTSIEGVLADIPIKVNKSCEFTKKIQVYDLMEYPYYEFKSSGLSINSHLVGACTDIENLHDYLKNKIIERHAQDYDFKKYVKNIDAIEISSCKSIASKTSPKSSIIVVVAEINPNKDNWYKPKYTSVLKDTDGAYELLTGCKNLQDKYYCSVNNICDFNNDDDLDVIIYQAYSSGGDGYQACSINECKTFTGGRIE